MFNKKYSWLLKFVFLKRSISSLCLCVLYYVSFAQIENQKNTQWQASLLLGYQTGCMNGLNVGLSTNYNRTIGIEAKIAKGFFSEFDLSAPLCINSARNQFYIIPGYGYLRNGNSDTYKLTINSFRVGFGYKSEFYKRFYIDTRISLNKYINESYNSSKISTIENYDLNEKYFIELSLSIGFCFYDNVMQKK
jgi:hypothetical protein